MGPCNQPSNIREKIRCVWVNKPQNLSKGLVGCFWVHMVTESGNKEDIPYKWIYITWRFVECVHSIQTTSIVPSSLLNKSTEGSSRAQKICMEGSMPEEQTCLINPSVTNFCSLWDNKSWNYHYKFAKFFLTPNAAISLPASNQPHISLSSMFSSFRTFLTF